MYKAYRKEIQQQADERFKARAEVREQNRIKIKEKGITAVEPLERVNARRALIDPRDNLAFERITGTSDLLGVNYLERGLNASRSVCRIQVRDENGRMLGFGTGFLVSPVLLMTNNHVLDRFEIAKRSFADFNYEDDSNCTPKDPKTFSLDPQSFFYTNKELDFTLVAVHQLAIDNSSLGDFGYLGLLQESGKALLGEHVSIVQHCNGGTKRVTVRENEIVDFPGNYIHYLTDTIQGASGSPVFNDMWEVVALHHAGVMKRDAQGKVISVHNDLPWNPDTMSEEEIAWVANEGVRISYIYNDILSKMATFTVEQQKIASQAFPITNQEIAAPPSAEEIDQQSQEGYNNNVGYDPVFLGPAVPLPTVSAEMENDLATLKETDSHELKYPHFSIVMSKSRRLAVFTAVNIDGKNLVNVQRKKDTWYFDPRIEEKYQCGPELYARNDLDKGHLVRRQDAIWNPNAIEANIATFHYTNCSPQHKALNQQTWLNLEDYILKNADHYDLKVSVMTGPVFRADDMLYRDVHVPAEFWKLAVMVKENGALSATAYLQTQKNLIENLEFAYGKYQTYQISVARIESLTKLNFGELRNYDPIAGTEATSSGRLITVPEDILI